MSEFLTNEAVKSMIEKIDEKQDNPGLTLYEGHELKLLRMIEQLQAERDKLKEALEWYADINNYYEDRANYYRITVDEGWKAREALGK